ncbi:hypothetical protein GCM10022242_24830 [Nocardioides panacisoli]|uniref:Uncharacterized protein n=1 Tax=Nocardioides panacisoli TaxID=627624 RepID=A0ABP7IMX1_9ACTN
MRSELVSFAEHLSSVIAEESLLPLALLVSLAELLPPESSSLLPQAASPRLSRVVHARTFTMAAEE